MKKLRSLLLMLLISLLVLTCNYNSEAQSKNLTIKNTQRNILTESKDNSIKIHDVQGSSHKSPYVGKNVTLTGIVTGYKKNAYSGKINGFYIQDDEPDNDINTSEAIFIYSTIYKPNIREKVEVIGMVKEYGNKNQLTQTEIYRPDSCVVISSNNKLPEPIIIGEDGRKVPKIIDNDQLKNFEPEEDAIDFYESLEFMRVKVKDSIIVGYKESWNEIYVLPDKGRGSKEKLTSRGGIKLRDYSNNPEIILVSNKSIGTMPEDIENCTVGDSFLGDLLGLMEYEYGYYTLNQTEDWPKLKDKKLKPEVSEVSYGGDNLTIATYNVENFSKYSDQEKVQKIVKQIVKNLKSPDIIALTEIEDNDGHEDPKSEVTNAEETYKYLIEQIQKAGGKKYEYKDIAPENGQDGGISAGNIRVAYLYNNERVSFVSGKSGDATTAVHMDKASKHLTLNPGRIDPTNPAFEDTRKSLVGEFIFNGESVFLINNHFSSKRLDLKPFGSVQPASRITEDKRHKQAQAVNNFVDEILEVKPDANIVVLGDMNDFEFSKTINILQRKNKENVIVNTINKLPINERYTYMYKGNCQALDNLLVSNAIADKTKVDIVHINSEFTEKTERASDHDPVVASIKLKKVKLNKDNKYEKLYIVHTNDIHGRVESSNGIGMAKLKTKINELKKSGKVIVLDAGDTIHGQTIVQLSKGQTMIDIMNTVGYDAMTIGNHDFNYGQERLLELRKKADFKMLSANVYKGNKRVFKPYTIKNIKCNRVGIFGLSTPETLYKTNPNNVKGLTFKDPVEEAKIVVEKLKKEGCSIIIALTHLGFDKSSEDSSYNLAKTVKGIDLIVDGHSHDTLQNGEKVNNTLIVQTGEYLKNIGVVEVDLNDKNNIKASLLSTKDMENVEEDKAVKEVINKEKKENDVILSENIGATTITLDGKRENVRKEETNLGNLITDAMIEETSADVAITNGGGIRDSIDIGDITKGEIITVLPFGNYVIVKEVTGKTLKDSIEHGISDYPNLAGKFPHVSGMKVLFDEKQENGNKVISIKINDKDIELDKTYRLATNDFMIAGGDGYTMLTGSKVLGEYGGLDEILISYIKKQKDSTINENIVKVEGRIKSIN